MEICKNNNGRQKTGRLFMSETICQTGNNKGEKWKDINLEILKKIGMDDPRRIGEQLKTKQCSFTIAIEKEEASFRTYISLIPTFSDEPTRETLLAIAEEEIKHKLRFETEYNLLLKKG